MHSYSLYELNEYIKRVIALNFSEPVWINAEISQIKESRGQVYLELVEHNEESGQIVAQSNAVIWYKSYLFIKNKLGDLLHAVLTEGSHVKVKVAVDFNERYGLKLIVSDIDASYTIGQMEMARKKILERLTKEGLVEQNKLIPFPTVVQRIAVISSSSAAGYQDFKHQLEANTYGYGFKIDLFQSAMQGQNVEREVVSAIKNINETSHYDCIAIIRGGGSKLDLSFFDNYNIACAIARNRYPVLSGIGHDIDQSVTDVVAHTALKTPTAVADHILDTNMKFESSVINKGMLLHSLSRQLVNNHRLKLNSQYQLLAITPKEILKRHKEILIQAKTEVNRSVKSFMNEKKGQLKGMEEFIHLSDPDHILKRGFAVIQKEGKIIVSSTDAHTGDTLGIKMHDGTIKTKVV